MFKILLTIFIILSTKSIASYQKNDAIDFELANLDSTSFVKASQFKEKQTLLIFFDIACIPCLQKLNYINKNIEQFLDKNIVIINLIDDLEIKQKILNFNLNENIILLQAPKNYAKFLRKFGNLSGALPYLVLLNKDLKFCLSSEKLPSKKEYLSCKNLD
jgi:peroxiredoxin